MRDLLHEVRVAARGLRRAPAYTVVASLTLALGIGATSAIFGVIDGVLLRPLPYAAPDELVRLYTTIRGEQWTLSPPDFMDFRREAASFGGMAAYHRTQQTLTGSGDAELLTGARVTGGFFGVLGAPLAIGRGIEVAHEREGEDQVAVLGYGLWQRRFGGDPAVVGRTIELAGEPYRVLGVAQSGFDYPGESELWIARSFSASDLTTQRGAHYLSVVARLGPGIAPERAHAELSAIASGISERFPGSSAGQGVAVMPMLEALVGDYRGVLRILFGAVMLVLLIACANIVNLALARTLARRRDLAIRAALGAGWLRLVRGGVIESVLVALLGGVLGLLLALWIWDLLVALQGDEVPRLADAALGLRVLGFAAIVSLASGLVIGLVPALRVASPSALSGGLREDTPGAGGSRSAGRLRSGIVVGQLAIAVVLLAGAALLVRSFVKLRQVEPGFRTEGVLSFDLALPDARYPQPAQSRAFYDELLQRIRALPGVEGAGAVFGMPLTGFGYSISVERLDGRDAYDDASQSQSVQVRVATADYFRLLDIPLVRGRAPLGTDRAGGARVVVVNEAAARMLWPGEDAVGRTVELGTSLGLGGGRVGGAVVGVVRDMREEGPAAPAEPTVFAVHDQFPVGDMTVVVRSIGAPESLVGPIRHQLGALDSDLAMSDVRTAEQLLRTSVAQPRFYTLFLAVFAAAALALAAVGIYGAMAYAVSRRKRELSIRLALGARRQQLSALVVGAAARLTALGLAIGLLGALVLTRTLRALLYDLSPTDPLALTGAIVLLAGAALLASWLPARHATRVDPMGALRAE